MSWRAVLGWASGLIGAVLLFCAGTPRETALSNLSSYTVWIGVNAPEWLKAKSSDQYALWIGSGLLLAAIAVFARWLYARAAHGTQPESDHWAQRRRLELHVIANVASGRAPASFPISGEPENSRLRYLKDEVEGKRLVVALNGEKPSVNTQVGIEEFTNFAKRARQQLWVRDFADRWKRQYKGSDDERYLSDTDSELTHAVFMMVLRSGWGRWYTQQPGVKASGEADEGLSTMHTAAFLVCDAAMNGNLEIRGRLPGEIGYEPIPKEVWRLAALSVVRDPATIWKVQVIPRHGVDPERIRYVLSYDSLVVNSRAFEELWPRDLGVIVDEKAEPNDRRTSDVRDGLAAFIPEGRELQRRCRADGEGLVIPDVNDWVARVAKYLKENVGANYEIRFSDYSGLTELSGATKSAAERDINFRIQRLTQFLEEVPLA